MESVAESEAVLLLVGFLAGALHVLTEPDHLVAMLPIGLDAGRRGWRVGLQWGIGHGVGIVTVGIGAYGLRDWLDLDVLSAGGSWLIAGVLVGVGAWGIAHRADMEATLAGEGAEPRAAHVHTTMAFGVGAVHGIAGTGALLGVVPVLSLSAWTQAASYLTGFGLGSVLGMLTFGALLGGLAWRAAREPRWTRLYRGVFVGVCWVAIAAGVGLLAFPALSGGHLEH